MRAPVCEQKGSDIYNMHNKFSHSYARFFLCLSFDSLNFAFSIATIITHFFDLGTFLKYTQIEGRTGNTPLWEFDFVMPRISEFAHWGIWVLAQRRKLVSREAY